MNLNCDYCKLRININEIVAMKKKLKLRQPRPQGLSSSLPGKEVELGGGGCISFPRPASLSPVPIFASGRLTPVCSFPIAKYYAVLRRFSCFTPSNKCNLILSIDG